jgi:carboxypeptidase Taq
MLLSHPDMPREIGIGEFSTLRAWLRERLYQHGRKFKPHELVERTTSEQMSVGSYLAYLRAKYGELYQLPPIEKR